MDLLVRAVNGIMKPTQTEPLTPDQVPNSAGGYVWQVTDLMRFQRFLILGSEGGTYYISEKELTKDNVKLIFELIKSENGNEVLNIIESFAKENRVFKQNNLMFSLAACCKCNNPEVKHRAYSLVQEIIYIPTNLFMFLEYCKILSQPSKGWGRAHRKIVTDWYLKKNPQNLAVLVTKYQNRNNWNHKNVLQLAHIKPTNDEYSSLFYYIVHNQLNNHSTEINKYLQAIIDVNKAETVQEVCNLIRNYKLQREHIPTKWFNNSEIWEYLLPNLKITAILRNLNKLTISGLFNNDKHLDYTEDKIMNEGTQLHPLAILVTLKTYNSGCGFRGNLTWKPVSRIVDALDKVFYRSFKNVKPVGQKFLLGLDVSGSMDWQISNTNISAREAAVALAMVTSATEKYCRIMGFSDTFMELNVSHNKSLTDNMKKIQSLPFERTDCSLPMVYALKNKLDIDNFIVYTDNETYYGKIHPMDALREYRKKMNKPKAKLIVVAFTASSFTIADPNDPGCLDIAGFDPNIPEIINDFIQEKF